MSTCATASRESAETLAGTAATARTWLLIEQTGPWGAKALTDSHLDPDIGRALETATEGTDVRVALIRRPGRHADCYGVPQRRLFLAHTAPGRSWIRTTTVTDPRAALDLDFAALGAGDHRGLWEPYTGEPLVLVCTNGKRDRCCALLGRPLAAELSRSGTEAWEVTHIGGHRFSPTLFVLPYGYAYGRASAHLVKDAVEAARDGRITIDQCRGRSAWDRPAQAADLAVRELLREERADALDVVGTDTVRPEPRQPHSTTPGGEPDRRRSPYVGCFRRAFRRPCLARHGGAAVRRCSGARQLWCAARPTGSYDRHGHHLGLGSWRSGAPRSCLPSSRLTPRHPRPRLPLGTDSGRHPLRGAAPAPQAARQCHADCHSPRHREPQPEHRPHGLQYPNRASSTPARRSSAPTRLFRHQPHNLTPPSCPSCPIGSPTRPGSPPAPVKPAALAPQQSASPLRSATQPGSLHRPTLSSLGNTTSASPCEAMRARSATESPVDNPRGLPRPTCHASRRRSATLRSRGRRNYRPGSQPAYCSFIWARRMDEPRARALRSPRAPRRFPRTWPAPLQRPTSGALPRYLAAAAN